MIERVRQRHAVLCLLLALCLLSWSVSADETANLVDVFDTDPASVYGREVRYDVYRNGKRVGEHRLRFDLAEEQLQVSVTSDLAVRVLGIPVYRYRYTAREFWTDGQLDIVESEIHDNRKKPRHIRAVRRDRVMEVTVNGVTRTAPTVNYPSNHWHPGVLKERRLFHTVHGRVHYVRIQDLGFERIQLSESLDGGTSRIIIVQARHYRYLGGFQADVWYDGLGRWVKLEFNADDGSVIEYRCATCNTPDRPVGQPEASQQQ